MSEQTDQNSVLSESDVRVLADLSRLSPSDEQIQRLRTDLCAVLGHAACLEQAPLDGVQPMARPVDETNKLDDDVPGETLDRSVLDGIAPLDGKAFDGTFIGVPRVIDGGGDA